ncbi:hypothetical protein SynSYN20_01817 [Synechococcus sp. SYN20]|nr:hypothetical protein SynSYN20_01817 [Synechococcus sp. SYN20]
MLLKKGEPSLLLVVTSADSCCRDQRLVVVFPGFDFSGRC